ncbi:uncharacterized protein BJ171DRAFT_237457 [Polychytrium aggregatum]|uniref:uncharacterized protein n=1 Tax=Polychytrium aggregatum TaxID=110093 RepID=UPI0022FE078E|nr:uncharacterized protein BJ171DRAFT_237457 [Polychytrium aggregatum]KAI9208275.1 hypothetical protein BJ171DRAFT_237457 [Polychytrium aggregatum]
MTRPSLALALALWMVSTLDAQVDARGDARVDASQHHLRKRFLSSHESSLLPKWTSEPSHEAFDLHVLQSEAYRSLDPSLHQHGSGYDISIASIHTHSVVRVRPQIDGIPVTGADRVFSYSHETEQWNSIEIGHHLNPHALRKRGYYEYNDTAPNTYTSDPSPYTFNITEQEALQISRDNSQHLSKDTSEFYCQKGYFVDTTLDTIRPVWKIVDIAEPAPGRTIRWIDAQSGVLVSSMPSVMQDSGLVYPEPGMVALGTAPTKVALRNVQSPTKYNGGLGIYGSDFRSFNTCFNYGCFNGSKPLGNCTEDMVYCAGPYATANGAPSYSVRNYRFTTDGRYLDASRNWTADGFQGGLVHMMWTQAPVFAPIVRQPGDGLWGSTTDFTSTSLSGYTDFVELQAYYYITEHLQFMKNIINDTNFCLVGSGPGCLQRDPVTNRTATHWDHPMRFVVNYQQMQTLPGPGDNYDDFMTQLSNGYGKNDSFPIMFYNSTAYQNAYFSNSQFQPPVNSVEFRNCTGGACVSILESPFNYFAFGVDDQYSWGLADCTVFHEMTHAIVAKYIPDLPFYSFGDKGLLSDPGALNEGWADYFAAIHCNRPDFRTQYDGRPYRSVINNMTCADMVGEIHTDSGVFSGALWEIRQQVPVLVQGNTTKNALAFDQLVLHAMAMGTMSETFTTQFQKIQALIEKDPVLWPLRNLSYAVFSAREWNCSRVTPYSEVSDSTFTIPDSRTTARNISTAATQILVLPRKSDWRATLSWDQFYVSPFLGTLRVGLSAAPLLYAVSFGCPIASDVNGTLSADCSTSNATVACPGYENQTVRWQSAAYDSAASRGSITVDFGIDSCSSIYVWISHDIPAPMTLYSISLAYLGWHRIWLWTLTGLGLLEFVVLLGLMVASVARALARLALRKKSDARTRVGPDSIASSIDKDKICSWLVNMDDQAATGPTLWSRRWRLFVIWTVFIVSKVVLATTGAFGIVALYYPPWRPLLSWSLFMPFILVLVLDGLLGCGRHRRLVAAHRCLKIRGRSLGLWKIWVLADLLLLVFTSLGALVVFLDNVAAGLHATIFIVFVALWFARGAVSSAWLWSAVRQADMQVGRQVTPTPAAAPTAGTLSRSHPQPVNSRPTQLYK